MEERIFLEVSTITLYWVERNQNKKSQGKDDAKESNR